MDLEEWVEESAQYTEKIVLIRFTISSMLLDTGLVDLSNLNTGPINQHLFPAPYYPLQLTRKQ